MKKKNSCKAGNKDLSKIRNSMKQWKLCKESKHDSKPEEKVNEVKESTQNSNRRISQEEERTGKLKDKHVCLFVCFQHPNRLGKKNTKPEKEFKKYGTSLSKWANIYTVGIPEYEQKCNERKPR